MQEFKEPFKFFETQIFTCLKTSKFQNENFSKPHLRVSQKCLKRGDLVLSLSGKKQGDKVCEIEYLSNLIKHQSALSVYIKDCQLTSVGCMNVFLNRETVMRDGLSTVLDLAEKYGNCQMLNNSQSVLIQSNFSDQQTENGSLSLNDLRTALVSSHLGQVLKHTGCSVKHLESLNQSHPCEHLLDLFGYGGGEKLEHDQALLENSLQSFKDKLTSSKYSAVVNESLNESDSKDLDSLEGLSTSGGCGRVLDLKSFIQDKQLQGYDSNIENIKVLNNDGKESLVLSRICHLESCAQKTLSQKRSGDSHLVHINGCNKSFMVQQFGLTWEILTDITPQPQQVYLSHSMVTAYADSKKTGIISADMLFKLREKQMHQSYHVKYGNQVKGSDWDAAIRSIAVAVIKLELLSVSLKTPIKIDVTDTLDTPADCRDALFVLYNCARLAKLFQQYEDMVSKGTYPGLPSVQDIDFKLLREEEEWDLYLKYVFTFPSLLQEVSSSILNSKSVKKTGNTNKVCIFLIALSRDVSSYYSRVHVLGESRPHLFPVMFARLVLLKAVYQIMCSCLNLLFIDPPTQM